LKKSILEIYALAVCFLAIVGFVIALGMATYSVVEIAKPEFTIGSWQYLQHQTNDSYWRVCSVGRYCNSNEKRNGRPSESELTKDREESFARELSNEQRNGSQTLVKCLVVMIINAVFFVLHWLVARRARISVATNSQE
jgi:hypothetical protein